MATLVRAKDVIPAKVGIQKNTGFLVKPGMTKYKGFVSPSIEEERWK